MRIAIIGGGVTGLSAAYELSTSGQHVTVIEKEPFLGGLAYGFRQKNWEWHIEGAYHHLFTNDGDILAVLHQLGLDKDIIIKRPITASLWSDQMYQLDSPGSLFSFPGLSFWDKIRTGFLLALLKLTPFWRPLEAVTAEQLLTSIGGKRAYKTVWEPLLYGKFGIYAPRVAAAWFWARIKKRTASLVYIRGGFHTFIEALQKKIIAQNGTILTETTITSIKKSPRDGYIVSYGSKKQTFDRILITIPTPLAEKLMPDLAGSYTRSLHSIPHLSAQTLILETDKPILTNVYWLNVTDRSYPFLAAVTHTNFMDKAHYGGHHLTYFGNYLPPDHPYLSMNKDQLLKVFMPYIRRLSPNTIYKIRNTYLFNGPFAQPVHELHYSQKIPPFQTPMPGIFLANMDFIVPWDRGTNYAVALGIRAARAISQ